MSKQRNTKKAVGSARPPKAPVAVHRIWYRRPILLAGIAVALAGGGAIAYDRAKVADDAVASTTMAEREIPATPWPAETHAPSASAPADSLGMIAPSMLASSGEEINDAVSRPQTPTSDLSLRIDGSSDEAMVDSINRITSELDEVDARAFQKAVRILMVSSLPIDQFRAQRVLPENMTPSQLVSGARQLLAGKNAVEVLQAAQARINAYRDKQAAATTS
jgi:hypothetical protein